MKTSDKVRGKWRGVLLSLGVEEKFLRNMHGPCPFCQGRDRYRWDNDKGNGTFICSQCGAGDGFEFLKRIKGWDFKTAAQEIDAVIGNVRAPDPVKPVIDEKARKEALNSLWLGAKPITADDMAGRYLAGRKVLLDTMPASLRFSEKCPIPYGGGNGPAMVALVTDETGRPATIHRTFLGPNGKADMENPRALMPGPIPDGSAVRLSSVHGARLGIAEGIETALAASKRFGLPVWAALNATMLAKWSPPEGVEHIAIFGDHDKAFGGQAAAYALAHRLSVRKHLNVEVLIPVSSGRDWADADAA